MAIPFTIAVKSLGYRWLLARDHAHSDQVEAGIRTMVLGASALPVLIFNAIMLADPAHDEALHRHVGSHPQIICELCDAMIDRHFGAHMARAVAELMTHCLDTQRTRYAFEIVFWCKSGRHRSVAAAIIWWMILAQVSGVDVSLEHMHSARWADHGCRGNCASCLTPTLDTQKVRGKLQTLLTEFRQTWMQMGHQGVSPLGGLRKLKRAQLDWPHRHSGHA